ncbi:MAG TPA: ComF family protein [Verrucomicrobiae bacterium]|jgi:ComF family protein
MLNAIASLFYPEICQICGKERAGPKTGFVCSNCWQQVQFIRAPFCNRCGLPFRGDITTGFECANCREMTLHFISARSAAVAKTVVLVAIHHYKYQRQQWFEVFLADLLVREALPVLSDGKWDFIVPVPLYPVKEREREFNQADRLAVHLSAATGIPIHRKILRRVLPTATQTRLTRDQRAANMSGAFARRGKVKLNGERVILVDDVFTTGATTNACARVLRQAGSGDICVWTVARGL